MLEFYQAYANYTDLMNLTEELFQQLADRLASDTTIQYQGREISFKPPFRKISFLESVASATGLPVDKLKEEGEIDRLAKEKAIELEPGASRGKKLTAVFEKLVEPTLWEPTFVFDYPIEISPLAKKCAHDESLVQRFELFIAGVEIANAYSELNDPQDQAERFEAQMRERKSGDDEAHVMDMDYVVALEHGMPPAAGEGIGIDRLTMLFSDTASIREVILFPLLRPKE
jgi:lysyl-tRNA synthetase class 2